MSLDCIMRTGPLLDARRKMREAEENLQRVLREQFPFGSHVQWRRGHNLCKGNVISHGYADQLTVMNFKTKKFVKISSYDIVEGLMPQAVTS